MKKKYEYTVGHVRAFTREAARVEQRAFRDNGANPVPRIVQKLTTEKVIR